RADRLGDANEWRALSERRHGKTRSVTEKKLDAPIKVRFEDAPLDKAVEQIGKSAGLNVILDGAALRAVGVPADVPVTIRIPAPVSLRSLLHLILTPLDLGYKIKDETLVITSQEWLNNDVYAAVYHVADLVIPIPNQPIVLSTKGPLIVATQPKQAEPDFDSLIQLITATIDAESWEEVGGPGSIAEFPTNLSLVVSQTKGVHKQIADLLDQLRRLQDIQVVMDIKRIQLSRRQLGRLGINLDAHGRTTLSARQVELLTTSLAKVGDANAFRWPRITLFNGQQIQLTAAHDAKHGKKAVLWMTPVATDQQSVRLTVGAKSTDRPMKEVPYAIDKGRSLLVDVSDLDGNNDTTTFLLLSPQVVIAEEERVHR
ncbi:MAG: hypothetical protein IH991_12950, partial [Planctomycetes bacterium]|nr:hypothetical protein [Planctomycetota bacterium]